MHNGDLAKSTM